VTALFYIAAAIAVLSTILVVTRTNLVHALLYLVVSLFAVAVVFYTLGAPFVAALEVIVYAGAIMMLFLFAVMLLNVGADTPLRVPGWSWVGPGVLVAVLLVELIYGLTRTTQPLAGGDVGPAAVSDALYGPYVLGVELASMLLLAALIGARHVAARARDEEKARVAGGRSAAPNPPASAPSEPAPAADADAAASEEPVAPTSSPPTARERGT
jgi:NADH-quinone oxidoreductase subunit J